MASPRNTIVLCAACLVLFFSSHVRADSLSEDVPVPGGRLALARALGIDQPPDRGRFVTEITRVIYDTPDGTNAATDASLRKLTDFARSTAEQRGDARAQMETVPVPLSAKVWSAVVFRRPVERAALFAAIMSNRRAALLCYGLAALDNETLQFLSDRPALLSRLYEQDASMFAA